MGLAHRLTRLVGRVIKVFVALVCSSVLRLVQAGRAVTLNLALENGVWLQVLHLFVKLNCLLECESLLHDLLVFD